MRVFFSILVCAILCPEISFAVGTTNNRELKPEIVFLNTVAFTKRDESSGATINSLDTSLGYIKLTATVSTINGAVPPPALASRMIVIQNNTGSSVTISHESGSAGAAAERFSLPDATPIVLRHRRSVGFLYDHGQSRWVQMTSVVGTLDTSEVTFTPSNPGDWLSSPTNVQEALDELGSRTAGSGGGTNRFVLSGHIIPFVSIDGPHFQTSNQNLANVYISALNSGTTGSITIRVNQYRAGALIDSATASLASNAGLPDGSFEALSNTLALQLGDLVTVDVEGLVADGAEDLSVEYQ